FSASLCHRFFPFFLDVFEKKTGGAVFLRLPPEFYPSPHPLWLIMRKAIISRCSTDFRWEGCWVPANG
ncbi:hypothetical protein, partial [Klebsiella pneumoniae]|uniref:hypothetical protein n=1 Tax=Klebsiella pneumoniae TaxID=573 RepID=UPI003B42913A